MKAILFHQHGGAEVLQYADFPTPEPKAGEALVRLRIASLLHPALHQTFPLKDAAAAQEHTEKGEQFGKITLDIG
jgi:NADPH:quinone reductase-like Zn-dependent oxidoreductase